MIVFYVILCVIIIGLAYCFAETKFLKVSSYDISPSVADEDLEGQKIVLLSDLHCKYFGRGNSRLLAKIHDLRPDMIIISGDLINGLPAHQAERNFAYAAEFLKQLQAFQCPVYYEFGNHELKLKKISEDTYQDYVNLVSPLCTLLNNEHTELTSGSSLYGLVLDRKYYRGKIEDRRKKLRIRPYLGKCDRSRFNIMIAHDPSFADRYFRWGANLVLSGHLHGGIVRLPFIGGIISPRYELFPKMDKGLYKYGDNNLIISGGLGWHGIPFRFNNAPEIVQITLHTK